VLPCLSITSFVVRQSWSVVHGVRVVMIYQMKTSFIIIHVILTRLQLLLTVTVCRLTHISYMYQRLRNSGQPSLNQVLFTSKDPESLRRCFVPGTLPIVWQLNAAPSGHTPIINHNHSTAV